MSAADRRYSSQPSSPFSRCSAAPHLALDARARLPLAIGDGVLEIVESISAHIVATACVHASRSTHARQWIVGALTRDRFEIGQRLARALGVLADTRAH